MAQVGGNAMCASRGLGLIAGAPPICVEPHLFADANCGLFCSQGVRQPISVIIDRLGAGVRFELTILAHVASALDLYATPQH